MQRGTRRDVEDELRRVLPERVAAGVVCSVIGAGVGPVGILLAGDRRWALAFFGLFTAVTALLTTFADLVPMRDGADAAQPAPAAPKAAGGMRSHLAGGARAVAAVAAMAAIASGHGGGNPLSRLAGVLLGAGLCSLASARWIASWERRTGQILLVGPAPKRARKPRAPTSPGGRKVRDVAEIHRRMMTGQRISEAEYETMLGPPRTRPKRRRSRGEPAVRYYVLPRDPALWPEGREEASEPDPEEFFERLPSGRRWLFGLFVVVGGLPSLLVAVALFAPEVRPPLPLVLSRCPGVAPLGTPVVGTPVRLGDDLESSVVAGGVVWAMTGRTDGFGTLIGTDLAAVDARTGRPLGRHVSGVDAAAYGGGVLWAAHGERLLALDPRTGRRIGAPISLGSGVSRLVVGDGSVWALLVGDGPGGRDLVRSVDMTTRRVGPPLETRATVWALAAGAGAVWVVDKWDDEVRRIDSRTGAIRNIAIDASSPTDVVVGAGAVWVLGEGRVVSVDHRTLAQSPAIGVGGSSEALAVAGDAIVVEDADGGVFRIDPRCDLTVGPRVAVGKAHVGDIAAGDGTAWIAGLDGVLTPVRRVA